MGLSWTLFAICCLAEVYSDSTIVFTNPGYPTPYKGTIAKFVSQLLLISSFLGSCGAGCFLISHYFGTATSTPLSRAKELPCCSTNFWQMRVIA
ncbi:hypothetical protein ANCCAN_09025 [Ancylostoma caninum]|uniref:Uncharacterized protein n=1 Tax=Ancylostoma caninum TaxID=29170 RepID=A0A368GKS9_ANCCA|nr:hypothetical protein ANCCAN_09025 [Ancylostoma caninum]